MRKLEELVKGGKILKTHGKRGEVKLALDKEEYAEVVEKAEFLFATVFGSKVPFQLIEKRGLQTPLVRLKGIDTPEVASELVGGDFFFLLSDLKELEISKSETLKDQLKGYLIMDLNTGQRVGEIRSVRESSVQDLAEVENVETGQLHLVPLHSDLIHSIDEDARLIKMELPEGLLEL